MQIMHLSSSLFLSKVSIISIQWIVVFFYIDATSEVLTCCLALPLHSRQRSSDGLPDWTCVIYGFKSGFVAFHTETGYPVHRQQFDINEVRLIKMCSPLRPGSGSDVQGNQELMVLYENGAVVIIDGMHLYASLQVYPIWNIKIEND